MEADRFSRRHLPHIEISGSVYFVTFSTIRDKLPVQIFPKIHEVIQSEHRTRAEVFIATVMPDHVHILLQPRATQSQQFHSLSKILQSIKGISARRINQFLGRCGSLWRDESYDRIVRNEMEFHEKWNYIYHNPVKANLLDNPEEYAGLLLPEPFEK